jgi:hypothetical protein
MRRSIHRRWAGDKRKRALGIVQIFSLRGGCFCDWLDGQTMPAKHAMALRFLQWSAGRDRTEDIKERRIGRNLEIEIEQAGLGQQLQIVGNAPRCQTDSPLQLDLLYRPPALRAELYRRRRSNCRLRREVHDVVVGVVIISGHQLLVPGWACGSSICCDLALMGSRCRRYTRWRRQNRT